MPAQDRPERENRQEQNNPDYRGSIRIFGKNMLAGPLFESKDAQTIVMYDGKGTPCVLLVRMVDNTWAMGTCADEDWEAVKRQFGVV
jgi:hypothetical protein